MEAAMKFHRFLFLALTPFLLAGFCFSQPAISLSLSSGPPTTKLRVSGSGFTPDAEIDIYFDSQQVLATADSVGSFSQVAIQVPASALPGKHWVLAAERSAEHTGTQAAFLVRTDWAQFHRQNMQRWNQYENVLNADNVASLQLKWSYVTNNGGVFSSPAVANGVVYFGSYDHHAYALDASTGAKLWSYDLGPGGGTDSSPAVANGVVYVGTNGGVYALNASTGALVWRKFAGSGQQSSPVVVSGVVYADSYCCQVYALDAGTGAKLWSYSTGLIVHSSPAVANGAVFIGSGDGNVYALNAGTGTLLWSYHTGHRVPSSPAVENGVVYVGSGFSVYALNANTGVKLWSYPTGNYVYSSPAVANGVVYVGSEDNKVYALNASTGALLWSYATGGPIVYSSPAVANGVVYVGSEDNNVYALDASTGARLWSYGTGNLVHSSPVVVNGAVYVGSDRTNDAGCSGCVLAFGLGAGLNLRATPDTTSPVQGGLLTYAFRVWNKSSVAAVHEALTTQVPPGTTFSSIALSGTPGLSSCTTPAVGASGPVVCHEKSAMKPGTSWTIQLTVEVTAPSGTGITENAIASSDNLASNTATAHSTVQ
jgi:outer membrane protein assembly factor BamB